MIVRIVESIIVDGKRGSSKPKKIWKEQIRNDMSELHLTHCICIIGLVFVS